MKVLFLTRYPIEGASSRYRVFQYIPELTALGVDCHVSSFMDSRMYRLSFTEGQRATKIALGGVATLRRLAAVRHFRRYDVIYMQRELLPFGPPLLERLMKARGAKLVFDYDDALFIFKPSKFSKLASRLRDPNKIFDIFRTVDCVVAGNDYLRDIAAPYCAKTHTVHVAEDTTRIPERAAHANNGKFVIGWLGSRSTEKYLELIREPLTEAMSEIPNSVLRIVGGGDFKAGFPIEHWEWSFEREHEALKSFDIGLMPLPEEEWSLGKSGGKARTYMAAGVVPVCTAIGYNLELIEHDVTGILVSGPDAWKRELVSIASDPARRQRIGRAARAYVKEHFSLESAARELHCILQDVSRV